MENNIELYLEFIPMLDLKISQEDINNEDLIKKIKSRIFTKLY